MGLLAAVQTSTYQALKLRVLSLVPLAKDAIHVYIGFGCYAATALLFRRPLGSLWPLLPGLLVSLGMEYFDLRDSLRAYGRPLWADSLKDIVNTNLIPLAFVLMARRGAHPTRPRPPKV